MHGLGSIRVASRGNEWQEAGSPALTVRSQHLKPSLKTSAHLKGLLPPEQANMINATFALAVVDGPHVVEGRHLVGED